MIRQLQSHRNSITEEANQLQTLQHFREDPDDIFYQTIHGLNSSRDDNTAPWDPTGIYDEEDNMAPWDPTRHDSWDSLLE